MTNRMNQIATIAAAIAFRDGLERGIEALADTIVNDADPDDLAVDVGNRMSYGEEIGGLMSSADPMADLGGLTHEVFGFDGPDLDEAVNEACLRIDEALRRGTTHAPAVSPKSTLNSGLLSTATMAEEQTVGLADGRNHAAEIFHTNGPKDEADARGWLFDSVYDPRSGFMEEPEMYRAAYIAGYFQQVARINDNEGTAT